MSSLQVSRQEGAALLPKEGAALRSESSGALGAQGCGACALVSLWRISGPLHTGELPTPPGAPPLGARKLHPGWALCNSPGR